MHLATDYTAVKCMTFIVSRLIELNCKTSNSFKFSSYGFFKSHQFNSIHLVQIVWINSELIHSMNWIC